MEDTTPVQALNQSEAQAKLTALRHPCVDEVEARTLARTIADDTPFYAMDMNTRLAASRAVLAELNAPIDNAREVPATTLVASSRPATPRADAPEDADVFVSRANPAPPFLGPPPRECLSTGLVHARAACR